MACLMGSLEPLVPFSSPGGSANHRKVTILVGGFLIGGFKCDLG